MDTVADTPRDKQKRAPTEADTPCIFQAKFQRAFNTNGAIRRRGVRGATNNASDDGGASDDVDGDRQTRRLALAARRSWVLSFC
jgi:hypothetical protein